MNRIAVYIAALRCICTQHTEFRLVLSASSPHVALPACMVMLEVACIRTYVRTYLHEYICAFMYACLQKSTPAMFTHTFPTHIVMCKHTCKRACIQIPTNDITMIIYIEFTRFQTNKQTSMHACMHAYIHTYIHACTYCLQAWMHTCILAGMHSIA